MPRVPVAGNFLLREKSVPTKKSTGTPIVREDDYSPFSANFGARYSAQLSSEASRG